MCFLSVFLCDKVYMEDKMIRKYKKELLRIQQEIVNATNMAVVIVDNRGDYLTEKSNYSDFCWLFRNNKQLSSFCEKCDIQALNKAFLSLKPYIYRCHSGLIDMVIPIAYESELIGAFLVGQIILEDDKSFELEQILNENIGKNINAKKIEECYKSLKKMKYSELKSIANILYYTSVYIADCIKNKKWSPCIIDSNISDDRIYFSNSQIGSAIRYINENINSNLSLTDTAKFCNISVSQFTRIFKKETGKTFKEFVYMKKIERAKYLLENTNKTIAEISEDLGMQDSSYFTKVFKKYTGVRPKEYKEKIN